MQYINCIGRLIAVLLIGLPSERIFSVAGLTVNKQRCSLKPKNVDSLVFLNKNLKLFLVQSCIIAYPVFITPLYNLFCNAIPLAQLGLTPQVIDYPQHCYGQ